MNKNKLLKIITKTLEVEKPIKEEMKIKDIEKWDSLGRLAILSVLDNYKIEIDTNKFIKVKSVKEFLALIKLDEK